MTDTRSGDSRELKQAVAYSAEGLPVLELGAEEWIFPALEGEPQLYAHLLPYEDWELKKFYDSVIPHRRQRSSQESVLEVDTAGIVDFIGKHFLGFSNAVLEDGTEPALDQQRKWLDDNRDLKVRLFRVGLERFEPRDVAQKPTGQRPILLLGQQEHIVDAETLLWSEERKCEERIRMRHALGRMSESDKHQYERSISFIENSGRRETRTELNWDVILGLYNRLARRIEGAVLDGLPCVQENREQWIKKVPFCMKIFVMASAYTEIDLKNA